MPSHTHFTCEHELKFCKECDIPYCGKCGKEWGKDKPSVFVPNELPRLVGGFSIEDAMKDLPKIIPINTAEVKTINLEKGEKPS